MVRYNKQGCLVWKIALKLCPNLAYSFVSLLDRSIRIRSPRTFHVLDMIHLNEVQQRQVRTVVMQNYIENPSVHDFRRHIGVSAYICAPKGDTLPCTRLNQCRGRET